MFSSRVCLSASANAVRPQKNKKHLLREEVMSHVPYENLCLDSEGLVPFQIFFFPSVIIGTLRVLTTETSFDPKVDAWNAE